MKGKLKITYAVVLFFIVALLLFATVYETVSVHAYAETENGISYDSTYVMDDLKGSTIDGNPFNLKDYAFDKEKPTKIFSFVEYCYSFNATKQQKYGLYVYVYNPQGINFAYDSVQNKIQFSVGSNGYEKYSLQYLNCSTETDFEGLFIKYKVVLSDSRKKEVLNALNSTERVYRVSGFELLTKGNANATDYPATGVVTADNKGSVIYTYSGYSAGYGADSSAGNTLSVTSAEGDVLSLEVHHTSWREKGVTNGKDEYTQDSLNSVYFAVPKTVVNNYGYLSEVHAEWLNAVTNWGLVTGNREVYNFLYPFLGKPLPTNFDNFKYSFCSTVAVANKGFLQDVHLMFGYPCWNRDDYYTNPYIITQLNWLFSAGDELNIADRTSISSDKLKAWYESEFTSIVGENYGETLDCKDGIKVYKALFENVDDEIKDYHIKADDKYTLIGQKWSQTWWEKHVTGGHHKDGEAISTDVEAIHEVTDTDFLTDINATCNRLYISTSDYDDFKEFYDDNKVENNIYLLRFAQTDYISCEIRESYFETSVLEKILDTNAYAYKQSVFLDFDIIDVTFDNGKVKTVIPVVSSPIDIFPEVTPPVFTTEDKDKDDWGKWLKIILGVLALILVVVIFYPILSPVLHYFVKGLLWLITAPFKALAKLFKKKKE